MIKVYVMESCPDCVEVKQRYSNDPDFELVDIGKQARDLKEFDDSFEPVYAEGAACNLDGTGC